VIANQPNKSKVSQSVRATNMNKYCDLGEGRSMLVFLAISFESSIFCIILLKLYLNLFFRLNT